MPASAIRAEIVQIEPWVYTTSARPDQPDNNYPINFGRPLGNQMGPHSRSIKLDFSCMLSRTMGASLAVEQWQKGKGWGSGIFDRNPYVIDTINGRIVGHHLYETKEYRFKSFSRDRVVVQGRAFVYAREWLRVDMDAALALDEALEKGLNHVGAKISVNY
jgi:hypothetical protein